MSFKLRDYQVEPADRLEQLLRDYPGAADLSDMGTGKTYVACETIRRRDKPTLVVAPKVSISAWEDVGRQVGAEFDVLNWEKLRTGRTPYGRWMGYAKRRMPNGSVKELKKFVWAPEVSDVFFDEAHMASGAQSQNGALVRSAFTAGKTVTAITATPADSPLQLRAMGYLLGLHDDKDFWNWCLKNGCHKAPFGGLDFTENADRAAAVMDRLNQQISGRCVRIRIADLPPGAMPDVLIDAPLIDIDERAEIDRMHADLRAALAEIEEKGLQGGAEDHPMTRALRARQRIELLHVPGYVELAQQRLDAGRSVLFFVNFSATVAALHAAFPTFGIIDGAHVDTRSDDLAALQSDRIRGLICNQQAGGVSLNAHDITGKHPRSSILSAVGTRAKDVIQCTGRARRNGSMSTPEVIIPVAAGTDEVKIKKRVDKKKLCIETLVDGDLSV